MKNSLTQNDLKCGMVAYEVTELSIRTNLMYILIGIYIKNVLTTRNLTKGVMI